MYFNRIILAIYCIVGLTDALSWVFESSLMHNIAKPLIMPILMICVVYDSYTRRNFNSKNVILLVSLVLYWAGDTVVMINKDISFVGALGLLLLGMIISVYAFYIASDRMKLKPILAVPYLIYALIFYLILFPHLGDFAPATTFFTLIMIAVPFVAHSRQGHTVDKSFKLALIGSIFLLISNSIAGLDRFGVVSNLFTAITSIIFYCAAHWLIVQGVLTHPSKEKVIDEFALPH